MAYTEENFQEWIFFIGFKMDYVTGEFAEKETKGNKAFPTARSNVSGDGLVWLGGYLVLFFIFFNC